jgi:hypothetical protein
MTGASGPIAALLAAATPTPTPISEEQVTPGVAGFFITFVVALAATLLIVDMVRRVRRVRYRSEVRERLEEELREPVTVDDAEEVDDAEPGRPRIDTGPDDPDADAAGPGRR